MEQEEAAGHVDTSSHLVYRVERPLYDEHFIRTQLIHRKANPTSFQQRLADKFE